MHFLLNLQGAITSHACVGERDIHRGDRAFRTGYVEAVAAAPIRQGRGLGSRVIADVTSYIRETFELGALGTGRHRFYERLGWLTARGRSFVRTPEGLRAFVRTTVRDRKSTRLNSSHRCISHAVF